MPAHARRVLLLLAIACAPFAAGAWWLYAILLRNAPVQDFMVFYTAARAVLDGDPALLFDGVAFTAHLNASFAALLAAPLTLHPFVYPPTFLLVAVPFGLLGFWWAYAVFLAASLALLLLALRSVIAAGWPWKLSVVAVLLSPATAFTVAVGQNAFLTTSLLVGGFGLLGRAPLRAGILLGCLSFKPQLWLLVPVALLAARQWRVLAAALVTAAVFALLSLAVFGWAPWEHWFGLILGRDPQFADWLTAGRMYGQSMFAEAVLLGASHGLAQAVQAAAMLAGALLVWLAFTRPALPADMRLAVLLTATLLAAPHVSNYDAVMLTVAVALLLCRILRDGARWGDLIVVVLGWSVEALDPPKAIEFGLITPLVLACVIAASLRHSRRVARDERIAAAPGSPA
jgi:hypothetical protein